MSERPYHVLRHRDFRLLWLSQLVSLTGSQMQTVALHWHVYLLTRSPLALGALGLTRVVPIILFSLFGGVTADRYDRRRLMFRAQSVMLLGLGRARGADARAARAACRCSTPRTRCSAAADRVRQPGAPGARPAARPDRASCPAALSLNLTMFHAGFIGGPALAGLIIAGVGQPAGGLHALAADGARPTPRGSRSIYLLNAGVLRRRARGPAADAHVGRRRAAGQPADPPLAALRDGLRFVFRTPIMVWTTVLDFVATFFAGSLSLLPIFADQVLHAGPPATAGSWRRRRSAPLAGSFYTSLRHLPPRQGRILLGRRRLRRRDGRLRAVAQLLADVRGARLRPAWRTSSRR